MNSPCKRLQTHTKKIQNNLHCDAIPQDRRTDRQIVQLSGQARSNLNSIREDGRFDRFFSAPLGTLAFFPTSQPMDDADVILGFFEAPSDNVRISSREFCRQINKPTNKQRFKATQKARGRISCCSCCRRRESLTPVDVIG